MSTTQISPLRLRVRSRVAVGILVVICATVAGAVAARGWTTASAQETEPWPAFIMTWRETANNLGPNGTRGTQLFRLEYTDRRHFRTTLLENLTVPDAVGSTWTVDGDHSVFDNARQKAQTVTNLKEDEYTVPAQWLAPGRIAYVQTRPGYTTTPLGGGLALLVHEETLQDGRTMREETTYRVADRIPVLQISMVNGVEVGRREAIDFKLGAP